MNVLGYIIQCHDKYYYNIVTVVIILKSYACTITRNKVYNNCTHKLILLLTMWVAN